MSRVLLGAVLVLATGCTPAVVLPQTYPAGGSVVSRGGPPLTGGTVQFNSQSDPLLRVLGTIDSDGSFTLTTTKDTAQADGAPEGEYKVFVLPPLVSDSRGGVEGAHKGVPPIEMPQLYRVEAKDNTFKLEVSAGAPPRL